MKKYSKKNNKKKVGEKKKKRVHKKDSPLLGFVESKIKREYKEFRQIDWNDL